MGLLKMKKRNNKTIVKILFVAYITQTMYGGPNTVL